MSVVDFRVMPLQNIFPASFSKDTATETLPAKTDSQEKITC